MKTPSFEAWLKIITTLLVITFISFIYLIIKSSNEKQQYAENIANAFIIENRPNDTCVNDTCVDNTLVSTCYENILEIEELEEATEQEVENLNLNQLSPEPPIKTA